MVHFLEDAAYAGPAWLEQALLPPLSAVGLPKLAGVAHITIAACAASFALQKVSSFLSPRLFPRTYPKIKAKQDDWDLHVVSSCFCARQRPRGQGCGVSRLLTRAGLVAGWMGVRVDRYPVGDQLDPEPFQGNCPRPAVRLRCG